mgnify:CR=1 FL=1
MTRIFAKTHVRAVLVAFAALLGADQLAAYAGAWLGLG